jgi:hypothetical protein
MSDRMKDLAVERVRVKIRKTAADLRRLADNVERHATFEEGLSNRAVQNVVHDVNWGVVNLNLAGLMSSEHDIQEIIDAEREIAARERTAVPSKLPYPG